MSDRPIEHRSKKGRHHTGRVWRLHEGVLSCDAGGGHREIPVGDIEAIHLTYAPTRFEFDRYGCYVRPRGRSWETIYSIWDAGFAKAEDHSGTYALLVRALIDEVANANRSAVFRIGEPGVRYWIELIVLILVFAGLATAAAITGLNWSWGTALIIMIAIVAVPFALMWLKRNRPRSLDPRYVPDEVLPAPAEHRQTRH